MPRSSSSTPLPVPTPTACPGGQALLGKTRADLVRRSGLFTMHRTFGVLAVVVHVQNARDVYGHAAGIWISASTGDGGASSRILMSGEEVRRVRHGRR